MKKIIGILGVLIIAIALFVNVNLKNDVSSDVSLANLIAVNVANAESDSNGCDNDLHDQCLLKDVIIPDCDPSWWFHHCN